LKTAIVKQVLDVFGPWSSIKWSDTTPLGLFDIWPGKALYWELTCMLQADWYIVPVSLEGDYLRDAMKKQPGRAQMVQKFTKNVTEVAAIPFENYDLVLTIDNILEVPPGLPNLFAFYAQEHWDPIYAHSLRRPLNGYDLFLAHMLDGSAELHALPQALSFPYLHDPAVIRPVFSPPRQEIAWIDWRTLITLANQPVNSSWAPQTDAAMLRAQEELDIPLRCGSASKSKSYFIADEPSWGDAADYTRSLAECRYYIGVGRLGGAGQGLAEAAAVGCLCIGQSAQAYHRLICHPSCLCDDLFDLPGTLRRLRQSPDLQREVLDHQDRHLCLHFRDRPLAALARAIALKKAGR
jgi:hypothetical protein